jgi:hypothetical protein
MGGPSDSGHGLLLFTSGQDYRTPRGRNGLSANSVNTLHRKVFGTVGHSPTHSPIALRRHSEGQGGTGKHVTGHRDGATILRQGRPLRRDWRMEFIGRIWGKFRRNRRKARSNGLRGKDLNLRPLGYESGETRLSPTKHGREWHRKEAREAAKHWRKRGGVGKRGSKGV